MFFNAPMQLNTKNVRYLYSIVLVIFFFGGIELTGGIQLSWHLFIIKALPNVLELGTLELTMVIFLFSILMSIFKAIVYQGFGS
jgi:hypothetical protein